MSSTRYEKRCSQTIPELPPISMPGCGGSSWRRCAAQRQKYAGRAQRWTLEEVLRTLIEAEIAARDASNTANRLKAAAFPVIKTLEGFDVAASSIPQATVDYLASLEWVRAQHNLAFIGPPGTGKSHTPDRARTRRDPGRAQGPVLHRRRPDRHPLPRPGRQHRRQNHRHPAARRPPS